MCSLDGIPKKLAFRFEARVWSPLLSGVSASGSAICTHALGALRISYQFVGEGWSMRRWDSFLSICFQQLSVPSTASRRVD
jgi:hypothetical protein